MSRASAHVPTRSCVGCNRRDAQSALARLALAEGRPVWDRARTVGGRGAYVHATRACLDALVARKPFVRSLRTSLAVAERRRLVDEMALM